MRKLKLAKRPYVKTRKYAVVEKKKPKPATDTKKNTEMTQEEREDFFEHSEPVKPVTDATVIKLVAAVNLCAYPFGYKLVYNSLENILTIERLDRAPIAIKAYQNVLLAVTYVNEQIQTLKH